MTPEQLEIERAKCNNYMREASLDKCMDSGEVMDAGLEIWLAAIAQRDWVGLDAEDLAKAQPNMGINQRLGFRVGAKWAEAYLMGKNT